MIIRKNDDGSIDEIVATGKIHIEQMSADGWFIGIEDATGGGYHQFWLGAKNRRSHVEVRHTESVTA